MSEIRFVTSSDEHIRDINPGFRKDDYRSAILRKLTWQGELASKFSANAVLRGGDLFDVKAANKTTMATLADVALIHKNYGLPTYAIAGNHDMSQNDPSSIPRQPLGVLMNSGVISPLTNNYFDCDSMRVRVVGVEYTVGMEDGYLQEAVRKRDDATYTVAFVHALASFAPVEKTQAFFREKIFDYRDLIFEGCPDVYIFGHYHKDQGIKDHLGVKFVNLGAVSRGALNFENVERKPKVSLIKLNSQGISIEEHVVPHLDAQHVFDFEKKKQIDSEQRTLTEFISQLQSDSSNLTSDDINVRLEALQKSNIAEDVFKKIKSILEEVESSGEEV